MMKNRLKIVLLLMFACAALYMAVKTPPGGVGRARLCGLCTGSGYRP